MAKAKLQGKVVWITGASSGIGRAIALEAAALGARTVLSGRRIEALDHVADECKARGGEAAAVLAFDLENPDARAEACEAAPKLLGPIDVLVLNAGMSQRAGFLETSAATFDRVMNLDFSAHVDMIRRCLPPMVERGKGCLVAISSFVGLAGMPLRPAYSAAKHALAGLFQSLRAEFTGKGIRIVTAYPGYVRTAIAHNALLGDGKSTALADPRIEGGADPTPVARRILKAVLGGNPELKLAFDLTLRLGLFLSRRAPTAYAKLSSGHAAVSVPARLATKGGA